jgi:hypothetical protein
MKTNAAVLWDSPVLKMVLIKTPRHYSAQRALSKMNIIITFC